MNALNSYTWLIGTNSTAKYQINNKQQKKGMKMKYSVYKTQLDIFKSNSKGKAALRKTFGKKPVNLQDLLSIVRQRLIETESEFNLDIGKALCEEMLWSECGSPVIFIENEALANNLLTAEFDFKNNFTVQPPFKSFALSFPKGTLVKGVKLTSCLVTIMTEQEFADLYKDKCQPIWGEFATRYPNELCVHVHYRCEELRIGSFLSSTPLHAETLTKNAKKPLPNRGTEIADALTRIALSLCIYHSATDGKKLVDGYPKSAVTLPIEKNRSAFKGLMLCAPVQNKSAGEARKIKYRIPFYRNLRAKRYYQGKYKDHKPGTRWVLVKEVDTTNSMNTMLH